MSLLPKCNHMSQCLVRDELPSPQPFSGRACRALRHSEREPTDRLLTITAPQSFAELQVLDELRDPLGAEELGLLGGEDGAFLLVHSGSRGFGKAILDRFVQDSGPNAGLDAGTHECDAYLAQHGEALLWARCNREVIARRVFEALRLPAGDQVKLVDIWHNNVAPVRMPSTGQLLWLHRKGAAPSDQGALVIPGSRGTLTYLALPTGDQERNAFSVAHGAGREMSRSKARVRLRQHAGDGNGGSVEAAAPPRNQYGGVVVCEDSDLLCEEAPEAYKPVEDVVADLEAAGVIKVVATLRPLVTYKVTPGGQQSRIRISVRFR